MPKTKDLYEVLGVAKTASQDEIKTEFRKLARKFHPDMNPGDKAAERRFKEISAAHNVLSDPEKRKLYDDFGEAALHSGFDAKKAREWKERGGGGFPGGFGGGDGFDWTEAAGGGGGVRFEDLFSDLFGGRTAPGGFGGGGFRRRGGPAPGEDVQAELELDFLTALKGGATKIHLEGLAHDTVSINVPAGVKDGQRLRLAGLGAPGVRGGPAGDLYVRIHVAKHPLFERDGDDLSLDVPITVGEALCGATITFPTPPSGSVDLKVPAGTPSGKRFRLRGLGVSSSRGKGDLYARVVVQVPTKHTHEAKELAKKLDAFYERDVRADLKL